MNFARYPLGTNKYIVIYLPLCDTICKALSIHSQQFQQSKLRIIVRSFVDFIVTSLFACFTYYYFAKYPIVDEENESVAFISVSVERRENEKKLLHSAKKLILPTKKI